MDEEYIESFVADEDSLSEEELLENYEEDDVEECIECGTAVREKGVVREIKEEALSFCTEACAEDYEEGTI